MKYRHRLLILLALLSMLTFLDRVCISVAGPRMQSDLDIGPLRWGLVLGAFSLAYAAFEIPSGMLGDRLGSRRVLTRIVLSWSVLTAVTGAVTRYPLLLLVRFLFGAGEAGAFPNISVTVSRWFPTVERARAQGLIWMATRIGAAISPLLVVPIQARFGWRAAFWIFGGAGIVWAALWHWWFRDDPAAKGGISRQELEEIGTSQVPARRHLVGWQTALASRNIRALMLMYFCYCYAAYFFISWLHTFLVKGRGFVERDLALLSTLPFLLGACANLAGGMVSDRLVKKLGLMWARRSIGVAGLTGSGLFVLAAFFSTDRASTIVFLALGYACSDFMLPSAWAVCLDIGKQSAGTVSGAMNTAGQLGSFASAVVFGYLVQISHNYNLPLIPIAFMLLASAAQWMRIDPTRELAAEEASPRVEVYHE